jgi:hypothetical protein
MTTKFLQLPTDIQIMIYEYDPTYRDAFDRVVGEMNAMLGTHNSILFDSRFHTQLQFKRRYQGVLGSGGYGRVHRTYDDDIRVASIEPEYEGCNSVLLTAPKVLLWMKISDLRNIHSNELVIYDDSVWERFHNLQSDLESAVYDQDSDEDSDDEDSDEDSDDEDSDDDGFVNYSRMAHVYVARGEL